MNGQQVSMPRRSRRHNLPTTNAPLNQSSHCTWLPQTTVVHCCRLCIHRIQAILQRKFLRHSILHKLPPEPPNCKLRRTCILLCLRRCLGRYVRSTSFLLRRTRLDSQPTMDALSAQGCRRRNNQQGYIRRRRTCGLPAPALVWAKENLLHRNCRQGSSGGSAPPPRSWKRECRRLESDLRSHCPS